MVFSIAALLCCAVLDTWFGSIAHSKTGQCRIVKPMKGLRFHEKVRASRDLRLVKNSEIDIVSKIEEDSFPEDEKASLEKILMRHETAGEYFRALVDVNDEIIGYINGTCIAQNYVTHESMETHDPQGQTLVLHSVTVRSDHRRQGHASFMLKAYLEAMKAESIVNSILLLCKADLCRFYANCGFQMVGVSSVVHGQVCSRYLLHL
jgi:GNAT superfamily N-acetyltransferase